MIWLEWRHVRPPLALLAGLALLLGLGYASRALPGLPPFAAVHELGPWATGAACTLYAGLLADQESTCTVTLLFAGRWFDWWAPLLATLVGALFGSRLNSGLGFLRLQPLSTARVLGVRLLAGVAAVTVTVLIGALLTSTRGALDFSWWPGSAVMRSEFWGGTGLVWGRGLSVFVLAGVLTQLVPPAVAALSAIAASLAVLGTPVDPFVRTLTLVYTPEQFGELAGRESIPLHVVQAFIAAHSPSRTETAHLPLGWTVAVLIMLAALLAVLFARPRQE
ncbi:hypothetical protein HNQ07_004321 [Deinococcus metalli]|uniref:Uncharacterized protein n=1 Tax=Deinococcus metalli TaxID=1141878 RepID=A0A7W8NQ95_9DEIO|nr:hypothetical protein [Deinococcus metalli]MBB5378814.1 hypothetical protein [Deinococcus metalli]GHF60569.1 hypothetical protein GCM10017781_40970 [Deinococcus metalli]